MDSGGRSGIDDGHHPERGPALQQRSGESIGIPAPCGIAHQMDGPALVGVQDLLRVQGISLPVVQWFVLIEETCIKASRLTSRCRSRGAEVTVSAKAVSRF